MLGLYRIKPKKKKLDKTNDCLFFMGFVVCVFIAMYACMCVTVELYMVNRFDLSCELLIDLKTTYTVIL